MSIRKLAIAGPDGAGKTTVCQELAKRLPNSRMFYGGKARNHTLISTELAYLVMARAQALWSPLYFPFRYFWFYVFEYFENINRFCKYDEPALEHLFYDRHPIDRMVMPADIDLKLKHRRVSRLRWELETLPRRFWAWVYRQHFNAPVTVFVLLPTPELCFERSNGQYTELVDASIRIDSYRQTILKLRPEGKYIPIEISEQTTVEAIADIIYAHLKENTRP